MRYQIVTGLNLKYWVRNYHIIQTKSFRTPFNKHMIGILFYTNQIKTPNLALVHFLIQHHKYIWRVFIYHALR